MNDMGTENGMNMESQIENISKSELVVVSAKPIVEGTHAEIARNKDASETRVLVKENEKLMPEIESGSERNETDESKRDASLICPGKDGANRDSKVEGDGSRSAATPPSTIENEVHIPVNFITSGSITAVPSNALMKGHEKISMVGREVTVAIGDARVLPSNVRPFNDKAVVESNAKSVGEVNDEVMKQNLKYASVPQSPMVCKERTQKSANANIAKQSKTSESEAYTPPDLDKKDSITEQQNLTPKDAISKTSVNLVERTTPKVPSIEMNEHKAIPVSRIKKSQKSELELIFSPYVLPGEKSLDEARCRLRTAIEQTRLLREVFTEQLYEKFRIVLKPVPKSNDALFSAISVDPKAVQERLQQQVSAIQNEKDIEKRISQQINAEFFAANIGNDTTAFLGGLPGVDNAEQLAWYGAGLSLVILPEDDVNEAELAARGITERSPIDPETGEKVRDVSTAAAVAGSAMLDRVRKGSEIRKHRIRKQQSGNLETDFFDLQVASSLIQNSSFQTCPAPFISPKIKTVRAERESKLSKTSRLKNTASLTSYLSISPDVEGRRPSGKPSAVSYALKNSGLKNVSYQNGKGLVLQQDRKHPFPQSKAVRHGRPMSGNVAKTQNMLPSPAVASARKAVIAASVSGKLHAKNAGGDVNSTLQRIMKCFISDINEVKEACESSPLQGCKRIGLKRKVSEIGLLLKTRAVKQKTLNSLGSKEMGGSSCVDPLLAMSVMQTLGLIKKSAASYADENKVDECVTIDTFVKGLKTPDVHNSSASKTHSASNVSTLALSNFLQCFKATTVATDLFDRLEFKSEKSCEMIASSADSDSSTAPGSKPKLVGVEISNATTEHGSNGNVVPKLPDVNTTTSSDKNTEKPVNIASQQHESRDTLKNLSTQTKYLPLDSSQIVAQKQQQAYALHTARMMTDNIPSAFYQYGNQRNGIETTVNMVQGQDIRYLDNHNQLRRHSFQCLETAQTQNRPHFQQSQFHPGHFLHAGTNDIGEYFQSIHQVIPQSYASPCPPDWFHHSTQQSALHCVSQSANEPSALMHYGNRNTQPILTTEQLHLRPQVGPIPLIVERPQAEDKNTQSFLHPAAIPGNNTTLSTIHTAGASEKLAIRAGPIVKNASISVVRPSSAPPKSPLDVRKPANINASTSATLTSKGQRAIQITNPNVNDKLVQTNGNASEDPVAGKNDLNVIKVDKLQVSQVDTAKVSSARPASHTGLKMSLPSYPNLISNSEAQFIFQGYFHEAIRTVAKKDLPENGSSSVAGDVDAFNFALCDYLLKVAAAVPIPKTLVSTKLRDWLSTSHFRAHLTSLVDSMSSSLDVLSSVVTIWLWHHHQNTFNNAFAKNGRLDVDPDCKWLIRASVEKALGQYFVKGLSSLQRPLPNQAYTSKETNELHVRLASLASSSINTGISIDKRMNAALPNLDYLLDYLDELRIMALRYRCQERVLLASLIAKRTRMSEAFSNAYTSSMVRAGAALGYDDLGEIVQDESTQTSSQLPFDILSDVTGAWEDPCRSKHGYGKDLDSDELLKRAHARAMIQRSLKRLQDRYGIKGGTMCAGPYSDIIDQTAPKIAPSPRPSPRSGIKRKASFSGTEFLKNMNAAATTALFNPHHFSAPFLWDDVTENSPYGRHGVISSTRIRSPPGVGDKLTQSAKRFKANDDVAWSQSTSAMEWAEVAQLFEDVKPTEKPSNSKTHEHSVAVPSGSTILAPFCRKIGSECFPSDVSSDAEDENMDDDFILSEHQKVLDSIKDKFDTMMRIRQEYLDRSRRLSFGR